MAKKKGGSKKDSKKEAGPKKAKPTSKKYQAYTVSGDKAERKNSFCPKCGVGVLMAEHKDRKCCGACGYTEFKAQ